MIGLNYELAAREAAGNAVQIGVIGAGQMGTDVVAQTTMMKGVKVVAVADIELQKARDAFQIGRVKGRLSGHLRDEERRRHVGGYRGT
jgi:predicted homoserine dehydrogenase-like protein